MGYHGSCCSEAGGDTRSILRRNRHAQGRWRDSRLICGQSVGSCDDNVYRRLTLLLLLLLLLLDVLGGNFVTGGIKTLQVLREMRSNRSLRGNAFGQRTDETLAENSWGIDRTLRIERGYWVDTWGIEGG